MYLTEEQRRLQSEIRNFAETHFRKDFMRHSRGPAFPMEAYTILCREGYMGYMLPKEYGGAGNGVVEYCILMEELARVDHNIPWVIDGTFAVAKVIGVLGTEEQKRRYIPGLIDGSLIPAFALTDLTGGSNLKEMGTFAAPQSDGTWKITGRKTHIHNCEHANLWLIFAGSPDGQDAILVEDPKNIVLERSYQPFGFRCVPCHQIFFEGVVAQRDGRLGEPGKGVMAALTGALNYTRIGNASMVIGIAHAAMDVAMSFAMGRRVKDGYVSDQQAVQHMLADLSTELEAASLLRWHAAEKHDLGLRTVKEASQAKVYATEHATKICGSVLRLLGAYGTYEEMPLADYFTSSKTLELGSGASEIHRNNIAHELIREYNKRFESGELFNWAQTDAQKAMLRLSERSAEVLGRQ